MPIQTSTQIALRNTMTRVGAKVSEEEFIHRVVKVFLEVNNTPEDVIRARFRKTRAFDDFVVLLDEAAHAGPRSILVVGCASGFGARTSGFAEEVVREAYQGRDVSIETLDITPQMLRDPEKTAAERGRFDLVVSHSLLHYVHDLQPPCDFLAALVKPRGAYLMANEPNRRFWANPQCVAMRDEVDRLEHRNKSLRRFLNVRAYAQRVARLAGIRPSRDFAARMNDVMHTRFQWNGGLTMKEIVRISDPHTPDQHPGDFRLGLDGLDADEITAMLRDFRMQSIRTSGYVRKDNPAVLPTRLDIIERDLSRRYPHDGGRMSVLWSR